MNAIPSQTWLIVSGLSLLIVAWVRFNKPPTNRSGTTFLLFYSGVGFYYALLLALWLLVILLLTSGSHRLGELAWIAQAFESQKQFQPFIPVIAAFLITLASPIKRLAKLETGAREFCMTLAAIPRQADQLAMELAQGAEFHVTNPRLKEGITREITQNIGGAAVNFENDGTPAARFTRAVSLYWLFIMPDNSSTPPVFPTNEGARAAYGRIMRLNDKVVDQATQRYEALLEDALTYFTAVRPNRKMDDALRASIHNLSTVVCFLLARYVLYLDVTASQRRKRLSSMGFNPRDHLPAFGRDQWMATILATAVLLIFMSVVIPGKLPFQETVFYSMLMAIQLGMAVMGGTIVAQRFIRQSEGDGLRFPPIMDLVLAALVVVGLSLGLRIGVQIVPTFVATGSFTFAGALDMFIERLPFVLLPLVCTLSVGLLCSYLGTSGLGWMRLAAIGAAGNGVALVLAAVLIGGLMGDSFLTAKMHEQPAVARLIMMVISGVAGAAVGGFVLTLFARSIQSGRIPAPLPMLSAPPIAPIGDLLGALSKGDISPNGTAPLELGSYNRASVAELEGRYVCFRPTFSNPKIINAYLIIVQWDEKHSCLVFEEQNRPDSVHAQKGKVYIPDGKPFISFVTVDRGAIRVIMVTRPDAGPARGLMLTLSNPGEMHFIPASAALVLRRIDEQTPQLGFVHPGAPDYDRYLGELASVGPGFARFAKVSPAGSNGSASHPDGTGAPKMRKRRRPARTNGGQAEHVENDVVTT